MGLDSAELGLRVAQARQRAGLKQEDLSRSSGLDRTALAKIETGTRRVTALELARIAEAVGERIEWFVDDPTPAIVSHRNVTDPGEPSPRIDEAIERVVRAVEFTSAHDAGLRDILQSVPVFDMPSSERETENLAASAREILRLDPGEPVHGLSSKLINAGVLTFIVDLGAESADAASVHLRVGALAVVNGTLHAGRRRLALAHEFGHVLVADEYTVDWRIDSGAASSRERAIDRFARAFLLPRSTLATHWRLWGGDEHATTREAAVRTASHFRVDMSTLARRLLDLGLVHADVAAQVRTFRTGRADIVEHNLVVADELPSGELPRQYEAAVLRLHASEIVNDLRAVDLMLDTWDVEELPPLPLRGESEIWQFVS